MFTWIRSVLQTPVSKTHKEPIQQYEFDLILPSDFKYSSEYYNLFIKIFCPPIVITFTKHIPVNIFTFLNDHVSSCELPLSLKDILVSATCLYLPISTDKYNLKVHYRTNRLWKCQITMKMFNHQFLTPVKVHTRKNEYKETELNGVVIFNHLPLVKLKTWRILRLFFTASCRKKLNCDWTQALINLVSNVMWVIQTEVLTDSQYCLGIMIHILPIQS